MIHKYKKISIIYGASGRECAIKIDEQLRKMHLDELYPIQSCVLAKEIMSSASILSVVKETIAASSACVIILTFDDVNNTRVRQNVLVEIGMALTLIEKENCFFISERQHLPEDFPSDLKGMINPNYFDKEKLDEVAHHLCEEIKEHLKIKDYRDILSDDGYVFDYTQILDDIPVQIFEEKADVQLEHILEQWENNIESFEFVSERIMYLIERLKFFPDFNNNARFFEFISKVKDFIKPQERDYKVFGKRYINYLCGFTNNLLNYTEVKLDKEFLKYLAAPENYKEHRYKYKYQFQSIAEELKEFVDLIEKEDDEFHYNWLIQIMAYEYVALAFMKMIACDAVYDESVMEILNNVVYYYEKTMEIAKNHDPYSKNLWMGYAQYNLTRTYENMYRITKDAKYLDNMRDYSYKSMLTRKQWFQNNKFKGVFSSALSFEYFLVCKFEYELQYKIKEYGNNKAEEIVSGLENVKKELNQYCESTGLGRLYDMRDGIDSLIESIEM